VKHRMKNNLNLNVQTRNGDWVC